jgi:archaeal type IV pilus assembly protein PilA
MHTTGSHNTAVSEVVGEMLMIAIVLIIASVFSASLSNYLPSERSPTVTLMMSNDTLGNITLWHKGGDWVKTDVLKVVVSNTTRMSAYTLKSAPPFIPVPDTQVFDLDDNITVDYGKPLAGDEEVVLATDRAVIFSGMVGRGRP